MNLIHNKLISSLSNWVDSTPPNEIVDSLTYNQYEINNPLRLNFYNPENIHNKYLRTTAATAKGMGAEITSAYINPFYLTHKIISVPVFYKDVVNTYSKNKS